MRKFIYLYISIYIYIIYQNIFNIFFHTLFFFFFLLSIYHLHYSNLDVSFSSPPSRDQDGTWNSKIKKIYNCQYSDGSHCSTSLLSDGSSSQQAKCSQCLDSEFSITSTYGSQSCIDLLFINLWRNERGVSTLPTFCSTLKRYHQLLTEKLLQPLFASSFFYNVTEYLKHEGFINTNNQQSSTN